MTPVVYKAAAGAVEHMKVARVTNINNAIEEIKNKGIWVYGADMGAINIALRLTLQVLWHL